MSTTLENRDCAQTSQQRFVPSIDLVLRVLGAGPALPEGNRPVTVTSDGLRTLLRWMIRDCNVDEETYAKNYPDVEQARDKGAIASCKSHFLETGYFEGRRAAAATVDEDWYLTRYPDVEEAIRAGLVPSAAAHYETAGYAEGRSPSPEHELDSRYWVEAGERAQSTRGTRVSGRR